MDSGLDAALASYQDVEFNYSAAFELLYTREGRKLLKSYHEPYLRKAEEHNLTYIMETPTWRANPDWVFKLGYTSDELITINRHAVQFLREIQFAWGHTPVLIGGCVGPRDVEFRPGHLMLAGESAKYHSEQVRTFALLDVDIISAMAINYTDEAIGIVQAVRSLGVPVVISFTVEKNGRLAGGETLAEAILTVDRITENYAQHFMVSCADLTPLIPVLQYAGEWKNRIRGIRVTTPTPRQPERHETIILNDREKHNADGPGEIQKRWSSFQIIGGCYGATTRTI